MGENFESKLSELSERYGSKCEFSTLEKAWEVSVTQRRYVVPQTAHTGDRRIQLSDTLKYYSKVETFVCQKLCGVPKNFLFSTSIFCME